MTMLLVKCTLNLVCCITRRRRSQNL